MSIQNTDLETAPLLQKEGAKAVADEPLKQGTAQAFMTMFLGFLGAGFLAIPYGVQATGTVLGGAALLFIGLVSRYTMYILTKTRRMIEENPERAGSGKPVTQLADIGWFAFGRPGKVVTYVMLSACQVGFCCSYTIFIVANANSIFPRFSKTEWLLFILPLLILLSWLRDLKYLAKTSIVAVLLVFVAMGVVYQFGFANKLIEPLHDYKVVDWTGLPIFWGICAFSFCVHTLVLPLQAGMQYPHKFDLIANTATTAVFILYFAFGELGYMFFAAQANPCNSSGVGACAVITLNLPADITVSLVKGCLCVVLICAFPVQLFPVTLALEPLLLDALKISSTASRTLVSCVFRALIVGAIAGIALAIPLFGLFSSLIGAFSVASVVFLLPPIFYLRMFGRLAPKWEIAMNIALIFIGIVGNAVASTLDVLAIVSALRQGGNN